MTVESVNSLNSLKGPDGRYLTGTVDVAGFVNLQFNVRFNDRFDRFDRFPVQFGTVSGSFYCSENRLTSLEGAPHSVGGDFHCGRNYLTSLVGVHRIFKRLNGILYIKENPIESGGIGLVLVEGLTEIYADQPALEIINGFLGQGNRGLLRCQEALHDAGFGEFAQL